MKIVSLLLLLGHFACAERLKVQPFGPHFVSNYETGHNLLPSVTNLRLKDDKVIADYIFSSKAQSYIITDEYVDSVSGIHHFYACQTFNGFPIENARLNVHIKDGRVIASGDKGLNKDNTARRFTSTDFSQFISQDTDAQPVAQDEDEESILTRVLRLFAGINKLDIEDTKISVRNKEIKEDLIISPQHAFYSLLKHVGVQPDMESITLSVAGDNEYTLSNTHTKSPVTVKPAYVNTKTGLRLVWTMQAEFEENWFDAQVDSENGSLLRLVDWVSEYYPGGKKDKYRVFPLGTNDPMDGDPVLVTAPANDIASPDGWHNNGKKSWGHTRGNNVKAYDGGVDDGANGPDGHSNDDGGLSFDFDINLKKDPRKYVEGSVTNLFYWNNIIHDIFFQYGFNEISGNFQDENYEHGGKDGDYVEAYAQDNGGFNNANFATPPDGKNGRMRMYLWNTADPYRDGDLESGIIVHEYSHGISTRLTGGPGNSGCLGWGEAGGMGEGWGDFFATALRTNATSKRTDDFGMGNYATNSKKGIRKFIYSTNLETNPSTFEFLDKPGYWGVHAIGEVWAVMLYEFYWNLVDDLGFNPDWYNPSLKHGNTLAIRLLLDGMKLQPCSPGFIEARDAILAAEKVATNGTHNCSIWRAFAKRGLGVGAEVRGGTPWGGGDRTNSFEVPPECRN